jgi:hypothetical protein
MNKPLFVALLATALSACSAPPSVSLPPTAAVAPKAPVVLESPSQRAARVEAARKSMMAYTNHDAETDHAIDSMLGHHEAYHKAITDLQSAVASNDSGRVAAMVRYPLKIQFNGKPVAIKNAIEFKQYYNKLITPESAKGIVGGRYSDLLINGNGILLGDGRTFLSGSCVDTGCKQVDVKISTIQSRHSM